MSELTQSSQPVRSRRQGVICSLENRSSHKGKFYWYNARTNETRWDEASFHQVLT